MESAGDEHERSKPKRRAFIALGAATLATACAGIARKPHLNRELSRAMYDVIIIGGSYAGLAAALQLARARRNVLILDAGQRRNRFAGHSHGFLGQDGQPPGVIASRGKAEVLAYRTVTWKEALATGVVRAPDGFVVQTGGDEFLGKRLILATGVVDELPPIPGLSEHWGKRVFFCPYSTDTSSDWAASASWRPGRSLRISR